MKNLFKKLIEKVRSLFKKKFLNDEERQALGYFRHLLNKKREYQLAMVTNSKGEAGICIKDKKGKIVTSIFSCKTVKRTKLVHQYFLEQLKKQ